MGLLSHKISLQVLQKSIARILEMEGEKKNLRERERARRRWRLALFFCSVQRKSNPGRGAFLFTSQASCPPTFPFSPSHPLMTRLPLSAEIKLQGP